MAVTVPLLSIITWSPFIGALLIMFTARERPRAVRLISVVTTGISAVLSVWIYAAYDGENAGFQFYEKVPLVPPLGISYELGVDGISLVMVLLTSIIIMAGVFASWTVTVRCAGSTSTSISSRSSGPISSGLLSASNLNRSVASDAFEINSRRKISLFV